MITFEYICVDPPHYNHRYSNTLSVRTWFKYSGLKTSLWHSFWFLTSSFYPSATPGTVSGISTSQPEPNLIIVSWVPEGSQCINKKYVFEYQLINLDQCNGQTDDTELQAVTVTTPRINLQELEPYSTYIFHVKTMLNDTYFGSSSSTTFVTANTGKMPFNVLSLYQEFLWKLVCLWEL